MLIKFDVQNDAGERQESHGRILAAIHKKSYLSSWKTRPFSPPHRPLHISKMPGRQSHGGAPSKAPKVRTKSKKRALDAYSIASHQNPDKIKIRHNRLGASEGGTRPNKRRRKDEDEEDVEEEQDTKKQRKGPPKGRFDELDLDEGSDSEGNEWKMGQVDSDDDSDLDSDEAFGESDEEKFEGFAFSGSSERMSKKKSRSKRRDMNLDEDSAGEDSDSELEGGDLGDDAVDLADMLDASESEDEVMDDGQQTAGGSDGSGSEDDVQSESSDDESSASSIDEEEASDPAKIAALQRMVANLSQADESSRGPARQRSDGASEYNKPSDFGLTSKTKLTLEDLGLPTIKDPQIKKSLKFLDPKEEGGRKGVPKRLEVPLAKRQQDRLDRSAAYDKSKETLSRWTDTVKHNRRADHLMFPLPDNDTTSAQANSRLQPTTLAKPFNELEATIQSILEESGLATANGKDDEDHIREYEELETNKMSLEEVKERRVQLRMARELLFREEAKAKRIKKIKSKSYRKVHRKQREKEERLNKEALVEGGFVPSEDELEAQDRRRATERMGQKHRGSKWAKSTKETGRAGWDEEARAGISEMARRDEELRKRVEGRAVRKEFEDESDASSFGDSDGDMSEDDEEAERRRLVRQLDGVNGKDNEDDDSAPGSRLANMKFMRKAEASKKKENDAMVEDMRRELAGEDSPSEEEGGDIGRRIFGPGSNKTQEKKTKPKPDEFEEPLDSDDDTNAELQIHGLDNDPKAGSGPPADQKSKKSISALESAYPKLHSQSASEGGAWSKVTTKSSTVNDAEAKRRRHKSNDAIEIEELDLTKAALTATQVKPKKKANKSSTLQVPSDAESGDDNTIQLPFAIRDQELIKRAFAGQDVVGEFETEKKQTIVDEDEKIIDNTLPGWGSWTGDGISKKEKARSKGRFLTKSEGTKEQNRKDAKLERVIINEKRVKKASTSIFHLELSTNNLNRMANILLQPYLILLRQDSSMRDLFDYRLGRSGRRKRHSKMQPSLEYCSSKASLLQCRSLCYRHQISKPQSQSQCDHVMPCSNPTVIPRRVKTDSRRDLVPPNHPDPNNSDNTQTAMTAPIVTHVLRHNAGDTIREHTRWKPTPRGRRR